MADQTLTVSAKGLYLTSNPLSAPDGSLAEATNAVIRRKGIVEPRRGQAEDAPTDGADAMVSFEGALIYHTADGIIQRRVDATSSTNYNDDAPFTPPSGSPMRFVESAGGLYATTDAGPIRLDSPTSDWVEAGVPPGLEGSATATGTTGWIPYLSTVGYRLVWGERDGDGALMLGAPSGRILFTNTVQNGTPVAFAWTRAVAVITATSVAHGLSTGEQVVVVTTSDTTAIPLAVYTITVTGVDTFTFTTVDAGGASGTGGYVGDDGGNRDVQISAPLPDGIVAGRHFLQVLRTVITTTNGADPGEDMAQVGEYFVTPDTITAGVLTVTDIASFASGPMAYFSPSQGPGLSDSKLQPPVMTDMLAFNGHTLGVVQRDRAMLVITLLGIGGARGLAAGMGLSFTEGATTEIYSAYAFGEDPALKLFFLDTTQSVSENIESTARSLVRVINQGSALLYATYLSTPTDLPGQILVMSRDRDPGTITVRAIGSGAPWSPALRSFIAANSGGLSRTANVVTVTTAVPHGLSVDQEVDLLTSTPITASFPTGVKTVASTATATTFTYAEVGGNGTGDGTFLTVQIEGDAELSENVPEGSWALSALDEPDAWPPRYRFRLGGPNMDLQRLTPQGDGVFFWTSAGLYRLTGRTADELALLPVDPTIQLVGPNTPVTVDNRTFALTEQGVVSVSSIGVQTISEPIDQVLLPYYSGTTANRELVEASAFGVGYESEHEYILFLPALGAAPGTPASIAYTYNIQTNTWVGPWEFDFNDFNVGNQVITGIVNKEDGRLYLSVVDDGGEGTLFRERKDRTLADYQDITGEGIPLDVQYQIQTAKNPGAYKHWVEAGLALGAPQPASAEVYFTTEIDTAEEGGTLSSQGNQFLRTYVPLDKSRSARLNVGFRHSTAQEKPQILGLSIVHRSVSTRVGR